MSNALPVLTAADLTAIERGIDAGNLTHGQVHQLIAEVRRLRAELQPLQESDTYGWQPLMREIAKLSDALGLDDGDLSEADDSTLLEQFDPGAVIRSAIDRVRDLLLGEEHTTALTHLDAIIAALQQPGLGSLMVAIRLAKEWRGTVEQPAHQT